MNTEYTHPTLYTRREAAKFLGLKESTLAVWITTGRYGLPFLKVGRLVRYRHEDLLAFLKRRRRGFQREDAQ